MMINHARICQRVHLNTAQPGIATAVILFLALTSGAASAVEKGDYKAPSTDGYTLISEQLADGDGDGVKETHVRHYGNSKGDLLFSMTTKEKLWAWSRQSQGGAESEKNYVIRDSNCDGMFNERYGLDDEYHIPDCLK